jgi:hypothetical protein
MVNYKLNNKLSNLQMELSNRKEQLNYYIKTNEIYISHLYILIDNATENINENDISDLFSDTNNILEYLKGKYEKKIEEKEKENKELLRELKTLRKWNIEKEEI